MEKQTMGKFIAALRKTNGMTQSDLAKKLSVSNKSVSKWECDDGYPDLTLIPLIAEIFSVTSDEILKGGRIIKDNNASEQPKSEKQMNLILQKTLTKFKNLSLIAIFFGIIGLIMFCLPPLISNSGGGNNTLFLILTVFSVVFIFASIALEIILFNNAKSAIFDFGIVEDKRILKTKNIIENWTFNIIILDILVCVGSIMPLLNGLTVYYLLFLPTLFVFAYLVKMFLSEKKYYDLGTEQQILRKIKKLNIVFAIIGAVLLVIPLVIYIVPESVFIFSSGLFVLMSIIIRCLSIQFFIIAIVGLIYIFLRKKLLKNYSKIK